MNSNSLWTRIKILYRFLKYKKDVVVVSCGYCNSIDVKYKKTEQSTFGEEVTYRSKYTCLKCGATCDNTQYWSKRGIK